MNHIKFVVWFNEISYFPHDPCIVQVMCGVCRGGGGCVCMCVCV